MEAIVGLEYPRVDDCAGEMPCLRKVIHRTMWLEEKAGISL